MYHIKLLISSLTTRKFKIWKLLKQVTLGPRLFWNQQRYLILFLYLKKLLPIRPTKSVNPTYEICPSNLRNMPIRPTKNVNPTYEKCPSDLQKLPIPKIRPSVYRVSHMLLDRQRVLLRFSENLRTNNHLEKLNKTNSCEKARFLEYYVFILELQL